MAEFKFGSIGSANPYVKDYVLQHIQETEPEKNLRTYVSKLERSIMMGSPDEAALLSWLVRLIGGKKILEIGVFRGTTTLALAKAVGEGGKVVGVDITDEYIKNSRPYFDQLGVSDRVDLLLGPGASVVQGLANSADEVGTYDFIFIDADKLSYPSYYENSVRLLRKGGVLAVDNVLWSGYAALPAGAQDDDVTRMFRQLNETIKGDLRMDSVLQPIADGVYLCRKL